MENSKVEVKIRELCRANPSYDPNAYLFIFEALDHAITSLDKRKYEGSQKHITGPQLLNSIRMVAISQFGWLAKTVFNSWGIRRTEDFGRIVFQMVEAKLLHKQDSDTLEDFRDVYEFTEAFENNYEFDIPWDGISSGSS